MSDPPKILIDDIHVGIRPEEIDSILGLRNTFDYFEVMGKYVSSYLELGWVVKLVIPHLDITLDLDFGQVREVWNQGLTDLAVKGIHTCLMVITGSASKLMVMEVHGKSAERALVLGRDWRAQCAIQVSDEREQHFFTWPQALVIPNQTDIEALNIQVFGEGGKVALPPSLIPGVKEPIRWLVPPWESPPSPPTHRLMEFLKGHFPRADLNDQDGEPDIPSWEEILAQIAPCANLMKTLLTPMTDSEDYYWSLVREARVNGLQDQRLLLGLLWHAPLGTRRHDRHSLKWFEEIIHGDNNEEGLLYPSQTSKQLADLIKELSRRLAGLNKERETFPREDYQTPSPALPHPDQSVRGKKSWPTDQKNITVEPTLKMSPLDNLQTGFRTERPKGNSIHLPGYLQGEIPVNRKHYEAMIYELGRLEALQKINKRFVREADSLKAKIDAQRQEEMDHLRQLVREKKNKGWW